MTSQKTPVFHHGNFGLYQKIQPVAIAGIVAAFCYGIISVIRLIFVNGAWQPLPTFVFFVALEAALTSVWLKQPRQRLIKGWQYRLAELILIALAARLLSWLAADALPALSEWRTYLLEPSSLFGDGFVVYFIVAGIAWERAITFNDTFSKLALGQDEAAFYRHRRRQELQINDSPFRTDRGMLIENFFGQWGAGGLFLGLCATLTTFRPRQFLDGFSNLTRLGLSSEMLVALLVYFLIGFWLISHAQLSYHYVRWVIEEADADPKVVRRWARGSMGLVGLIALLAALLPIGSTFGLARIMLAVLGVGAVLLNAIFGFFLSLLFLLISFLRPTGSEGTTSPPPAAPALPPLVPPAQEAFELSETAEMAVGGVFWAVLAAVCLIAAFFFWRERRDGMGMPAARNWWTMIKEWAREWWRALWIGADAVRQEIEKRISNRTSQSSPASAPWRILRVNKLAPRQQIQYFYYSVTRRAGNAGIPRQRDETPLEYAETLKERLPEQSDQVDRMTDAFISARYNPAPIPAKRAGRIKSIWRELRNKLKRLQRPK